jgi:hypothetical protein
MKTIVYWVTTVLVALLIGSGGVGQGLQYLANPHGVVPTLAYPRFFSQFSASGSSWERLPSSCRDFRSSRGGRTRGYSSI